MSGSYLHRVLLLIRLLVEVLSQEIPGGFGALGSVELPAPQGERTEGKAEGQALQGLVDREIVLLQVPVVIEVEDGVVVATDGVKLHIWSQGKEQREG